MVGWQGFDIASFLQDPAMGDGAITAVSRIKDHMEVFWISPDGSVQDNYWYPTQTPNWKRFELAPRGSADVQGGIAAVSRQAGSMEVWWIGTAGSIEGAWWTEADGWHRYQLAPDHSTTPHSAIYGQSRMKNLMNVWWVGLRGSIEGCFFVEGVQKPWNRYQIAGDGSAALQTALTAVSRIPNSEELWWTSPAASVEGAFWYEDGKPWQRYQIAPSGSAAIGSGMKVRSRQPQIMNLWWIHPNGSVQGAFTVVPKAWSRYELAPPGSASTAGGLTAVSRIPTSEEIFWVGQNGEIKDGYWYEGFTTWQTFDLAPAGSARYSSKLASVSRIAGSMEMWYSSSQGIMKDLFFYDIPHYDFSVDKINCAITRSAHNDTLHIGVSVTVAGRPAITMKQDLGEHAEGITIPHVPVLNVPVADNEIVTFAYLIINNGHDNEAQVIKLLESGVTQIAQSAAQAAGASIGGTVGALVGIPIPIVGPIVGAALGAVAGALFGELFANCDGLVAAGSATLTGAALGQKLANNASWGATDQNPGLDSPAGCGRKSAYSTTWSIRHTPE